MDNKTIRFKKILLVSLVIVIMYALVIKVYDYLAKIGAAINLDDANVPLVMLKADDCNSPYVENEVVSFFKDNDAYFKYIDTKSINVINIIDKQTVSSGEKNEKFVCSGIIEITSDKKGFRPKIFDEDNLFYSKIYLLPDKQSVIKYTIYRLPVNYSTKISDGNHSIEINKLDLGEFQCNGICKTEYIAKHFDEPPVIKPSDTKQNSIEEKNHRQSVFIFNKSIKEQKTTKSDINTNNANTQKENINTLENKTTDIDKNTKKENKFINFIKRKKENRKNKKVKKLIIRLQDKEKN